MSKLRFGIIGAGAIATATCRELAWHPDADIVAVADTNADRARAFADRYGVDTVLDAADDLLSLDVIDAVYVAVPNKLHAPFAKAALKAGKHTLLDKPFAMNVAQAERVIAAAEASGKHFMLGMNQRFTREAQSAKVLADRGTLGEIYHAKAYWRRRSGIPRIGSWFTHKAVSGGGGLLDIGVHMLDVALYVMDNFEPVAVSGATYTKFGNRGLGDGAWGQSEIEDDVFDVDDFATALIKFANGATVTLDTAWAMHQENANEMNVELYGTEAALSTYQSRLYKPGEDGYLTVQSPATGDLPFPHMSRVHHFIDVVLERAAPVVTPNQALAVQRILDGIYQSAETGSEVKL